jgi:hypothetical protein
VTKTPALDSMMGYPEGAALEIPGNMNKISGSNQQLPIPSRLGQPGTFQLQPNGVPNRDSMPSSNRASFNMSDGQALGTEGGKKVMKGPAVYPAEHYYLVDRWMPLYQDAWVKISLKRTSAVLSKNKIYEKINVSVENLTSSAMTQVSMKIRNNPPSRLLLTET